MGTSIRTATVDYTVEEFAHVMDTNFASFLLLTQVRMPVFSLLFPSKSLFRVVRMNGHVGNLVCIRVPDFADVSVALLLGVTSVISYHPICSSCILFSRRLRR